METLLRRFALAVGLLCGLAATQAPEFAQQYRQRLAGAVDELARVIAIFDAEARDKQMTPEAAIARLEANLDALARERGTDMANDKVRLARLQDALAASAAGGAVGRLLGFLRSFDPAIAGRAWADFEPAVPTSFEALAVGAVGWAFGWAATHLAARPARRLAQGRKARRA
jgi:hypothetical protein